MIDRAALAGMAIGVGVLLIVQQIFANTPSYILLLVGIVVGVFGCVVWSDLRERGKVVDRADHDRKESR